MMPERESVEAVQLNAKIDLANAKIDSLAAETRQGFDTMRQVSDEHWKGFEARLDASAREQRQQIEFLTTNNTRLQSDTDRIAKDLAATDIAVAATDTALKRLQDKQINITDDLKAMADNLKWTVRTLAVAAVGFATWAFQQYITTTHR